MPDLVSPESLGPSDGPYGVEPEAWLAAIVDSSDDAIIGKTLDSVIRSWNVGATRIFGFAAHEAIGRPVYQIIPPELHHQELAIISRLVQGERIDHFETVRLRKDGTRIDVSLSVSPIRLLVTARRRPTWATAGRVLYGSVTLVGRDELAMTEEEVRRVVGEMRPAVVLLRL